MRVCASCARLLPGDACPFDGAAAIVVDRLEPGARIGPYTVMNLVGKGGMGHVYEAVHESLGRRVAIKFLRDDIDDDELPHRFLREARAVNRIDHDNVISITDYGDGSGGAVYFVMEFLAGETLWDLNHRHRQLELPLIREIYLQIMAALEAAHRRDVIHRDLKPTNVMIVERERTPHFVKLLDFGLARLVDPANSGPGLTIEGTIMGTPEYMSPEQIDGKTADARSDVYALGVMLYESVTGDVPFPAAGVSFLALARQILDEPPVPPGQRRSIPAALDRLIMRALAKDPADRYPGVEAMRRDFEAAIGAPAPVVDEDPLDTAETVPSISGIEAMREPPQPRAAPRGRTGWAPVIAVAIGAVIAAGVGIAVGLSGGGAAVDAAPVDARPATIAGLWAAGERGAAVAMARASLERDIDAGDEAAMRGVIAAATPTVARHLYAALEAGPQLRAGAAAAIAELQLFDGVKRIQDAINESGPALRVELTAALYRLNAKSVEPVLLEALDGGLLYGGGDRNAALVAAEALATRGEPAALVELREVLEAEPPGRDRWLRAAAALGRAGDPAALRALAEQLGGSDDSAAVAAAEVLALSDAAAASFLDRVVSDPQFSARREAALALARRGRAAALDFVEPALGGSDRDKVAAIAVAARLAKRGGERHAAAIARLAESANLEVSAAARAALLAF
jgi:serine/threonine-protein kinase